MKNLIDIKYWLFDLDNTLYSGQTKVFSEVDKKKLLPEINFQKAKELIDQEIISGGMIPKINNCLDVASNGVKGVVIIDGRKNHSLLFELLSDKGSGTLIREWKI